MEKDDEGRRWKQKANDKRDDYLEKKVMEADKVREEAEEANRTGSGEGACPAEEEEEAEESRTGSGVGAGPDGEEAETGEKEHDKQGERRRE